MRTSFAFGNRPGTYEWCGWVRRFLLTRGGHALSVRTPPKPLPSGRLDVADVVSAHGAATLGVQIVTSWLFPHGVVFERRLGNLDKSP